jgi:hypothetical protein
MVPRKLDFGFLCLHLHETESAIETRHDAPKVFFFDMPGVCYWPEIRLRSRGKWMNSPARTQMIQVNDVPAGKMRDLIERAAMLVVSAPPNRLTETMMAERWWISVPPSYWPV